jgi:hypothetical protein
MNAMYAAKEVFKERERRKKGWSLLSSRGADPIGSVGDVVISGFRTDWDSHADNRADWRIGSEWQT